MIKIFISCEPPHTDLLEITIENESDHFREIAKKFAYEMAKENIRNIIKSKQIKNEKENTMA